MKDEGECPNSSNLELIDSAVLADNFQQTLWNLDRIARGTWFPLEKVRVFSASWFSTFPEGSSLPDGYYGYRHAV